MKSKFFLYGLIGVATVAFSISSAKATTIDVVPWLAPNVYGSTSSFATAQANAVAAMHDGVTSYGTPGTPTYFQARSNVSAQDVVVTGFNSWLGQVDPGAVFGSAFAAELGNRMTFAARIDGEGNQISISNLSFVGNSTDYYNGSLYNGLGFSFGSGAYGYSDGYQGVLKGSDGILWTADDTFITGGANTQLVDGIVARGSGNSFAAYCSSCSLADQQTALLASAFYPGVDFQFTGVYSLGSAVGSATFNISAVPLPASLPLFLTGLAGLGLAGRRRRKGNNLAA